MRIKKVTHRFDNNLKIMNLQNAVTVASVAEVLEPKVSLAFRELVTQRFLELRTVSAHLAHHKTPLSLSLSLSLSVEFSLYVCVCILVYI